MNKPTDMRPVAKDDDGHVLYTLDEYLAFVSCNALLDGGAYYLATETEVSDIETYPSDLMSLKPGGNWATHIAWYNK